MQGISRYAHPTYGAIDLDGVSPSCPAMGPDSIHVASTYLSLASQRLWLESPRR